VILVDTSVWVDHLRRTEAALSEALLSGVVLAHPFVIGEIAWSASGRNAEPAARPGARRCRL